MKKITWKGVKQACQRRKVDDFLRNFAAVVLGIAITFAGNNLITERQTQRELKKTMQLVVPELQINKAALIEIQDNYLREVAYATLLLRHQNNLKEVPQDSIPFHNSPLFQFNTPTPSYDVLELLKSSSLLQRIPDKELALQIIKVYNSIRMAYSKDEFGNNRKNEYISKIIDLPAVKEYHDNDKSNVDNWTFYLSLNEVKQYFEHRITLWVTHPFQDTINLIDETVATIEKNYR
jgi:hypothetical protein